MANKATIPGAARVGYPSVKETIMNQYKIFDMHTHAFPDKIAAATMQTLSRAAGIPNHHDGSYNGLKEYEARNGADGFLLLPIATKATSVQSINRWVADKISRETYAFGSLHPQSADITGDAEHLKRLGLLGVKLHPEYQEFYADDPRMFPFYDEIFSRGLPIYFHAGADLGFPPPIRGDARRIANVAKKYPNGRIIAAHMGGFMQLEKVLRFLAGLDNVWMDTSFAAQRMAPGEITNLVRRHGAEKFFFGTDSPWSDFTQARDALLNSGLGQDELRAIFWDNAASFLGIK